MKIQQSPIFTALKKVLDSYSLLSDDTWEKLQALCEIKRVDKNTLLYKHGEIPDSFAFVYSGLFRMFITDAKGNEYNKIFFKETSFPGAMTSLLTQTPSRFSIESLEPACVILLNFRAYRQLLEEKEDLKRYHIFYLEKNWLLEKDAREVEMAQENATQRYQRFLQEHADISSRISQYHIAAHLGITPTQLSRIRKYTL
jgi:CRP-like cAMP-binding protein